MPGEDNFDSERFVTIEYVHPGAIHHQLKKKVAQAARDNWFI